MVWYRGYLLAQVLVPYTIRYAIDYRLFLIYLFIFMFTSKRDPKIVSELTLLSASYDVVKNMEMLNGQIQTEIISF